MSNLIPRLQILFRPVFTLLSISLITCNITNAALLDLGMTTQDTDTGLEWLDLTKTTGLTAAEALAANPTFQHGTSEQVRQLWDSANVRSDGAYATDFTTEEQQFIDLIGRTTQTIAVDGTVGIINDASVAFLSSGVPDSNALFTVISSGDGIGIPDFKDPKVGHYIYRQISEDSPTVVPEPSNNALNRIGDGCRPGKRVSKEKNLGKSE